jgi:hypothetical protein
MIGFKVKLQREIERALKRATEKGIFRSLGHAAAAIRSTAKRLITVVAKGTPSKPGEPIHSKTRRAKKSVLFGVDRSQQEAVIGFNAAYMGRSMEAHEHGGQYMDTDYPVRPTMGPALQANLVRFAAGWEGSIEE